MTVTLKLTDVQTGTPTPPRRWDNATKSYETLDPCDVFLAQLGQSDRPTEQLRLQHVEMPRDAAMYHRNFLNYLEKCWADHLGVVVTPDTLWFTLLGELVSLVSESPEPYRHLFTTSHAKQEIVVLTDDPVVMPLHHLVVALRERVPTDTGLFMPEFTTTSERTRHARYAAFCDLCSPYYDYMMLLCAFPAIQVQGTRDDWDHMVAQWVLLRKLFRAADKWMSRVEDTLRRCAESLTDADWWHRMFAIKRCGSGHQTEASGWLLDLYRVQPQLAYVSNFSTHVAQVYYKELTSQREFKLQEGLFFSYREGDFMVPDFGYTVHEK